MAVNSSATAEDIKEFLKQRGLDQTLQQFESEFSRVHAAQKPANRPPGGSDGPLPGDQAYLQRQALDLTSGLSGAKRHSTENDIPYPDFGGASLFTVHMKKKPALSMEQPAASLQTSVVRVSSEVDRVYSETASSAGWTYDASTAATSWPSAAAEASSRSSPASDNSNANPVEAEPAAADAVDDDPASVVALSKLDAELASVGANGDGLFACPSCGKAFTFRTNLRRHMAGHVGLKKHVCGVCKQRFTRSDDLTSHMRSHTGDRPYACDVPGCVKRFLRVSDLKAHEKSHAAAAASSASRGPSSSSGGSRRGSSGSGSRAIAPTATSATKGAAPAAALEPVDCCHAAIAPGNGNKRVTRAAASSASPPSSGLLELPRVPGATPQPPRASSPTPPSTFFDAPSSSLSSATVYGPSMMTMTTRVSPPPAAPTSSSSAALAAGAPLSSSHADLPRYAQLQQVQVQHTFTGTSLGGGGISMGVTSSSIDGLLPYSNNQPQHQHDHDFLDAHVAALQREHQAAKRQQYGQQQQQTGQYGSAAAIGSSGLYSHYYTAPAQAHHALAPMDGNHMVSMHHSHQQHHQLGTPSSALTPPFGAAPGGGVSTAAALGLPLQYLKQQVTTTGHHQPPMIGGTILPPSPLRMSLMTVPRQIGATAANISAAASSSSRLAWPPTNGGGAGSASSSSDQGGPGRSFSLGLGLDLAGDQHIINGPAAAGIGNSSSSRTSLPPPPPIRSQTHVMDFSLLGGGGFGNFDNPSAASSGGSHLDLSFFGGAIGGGRQLSFPHLGFDLGQH